MEPNLDSAPSVLRETVHLCDRDGNQRLCAAVSCCSLVTSSGYQRVIHLYRHEARNIYTERTIHFYADTLLKYFAILDWTTDTHPNSAR